MGQIDDKELAKRDKRGKVRAARFANPEADVIMSWDGADMELLRWLFAWAGEQDVALLFGRKRDKSGLILSMYENGTRTQYYFTSEEGLNDDLGEFCRDLAADG